MPTNSVFCRKDSPVLKLKWLDEYRRSNCRPTQTSNKVGVSHVTVGEWEKDDRPLLEIIEGNRVIPLLESEACITKDSRERIRNRVKEEINKVGSKTGSNEGNEGNGGSGNKLIKQKPFKSKKSTFNALKKAIEDELAEKIEGKLVKNALDDDVKNTLPRIFYLKHNMAKYRENQGYNTDEPVPMWWEDKKEDPKVLEKPGQTVDKSKK